MKMKIKGMVRSKNWARQVDMEINQDAPYTLIIDERGVRVVSGNEQNQATDISFEGDLPKIPKPPMFSPGK